MNFYPLRFLLLVAGLIISVHAQRTCTGKIQGPRVITHSITVSSSCWLEDVTVTGSLTVTTGASLITTGNVSVSGSLRGADARELNLGGYLNVLGGLSAIRTAKLSIAAGANVGMVNLVDVPHFRASGTMTSINAMGGGPIVLRGARVLGGGIRRTQVTANPAGNSDVVICGGTVGGGIAMSGVSGSVKAVVSPTCAPSEMSGTIMVDKGIGSILIVGNVMRAADVLIGEQVGDVTLTNAVVSDLSMSRITGNILFQGVKSNSDSTINLNTGSITVTGGSLNGDMLLTGNSGPITIRNNNLNNEMMSITANTGMVTVSGNRGFNGVINENGGVTFINNQSGGASITKNFKKTTIHGNSFGLGGLICADNAPAPTGYGNTFNRLAVRSGQCGSF